MNSVASVIESKQENNITAETLHGRYPFSPFPRGWYVIGKSISLKKGCVKTFHYFNQDIVIFRGQSGKLGAVDPHCPHLGAHLGIGGTVKNDRLICPFHQWEFNSDGFCQHIPYATRIPKKAKAKHWPIAEASGLLFIYYGVDGELPPNNLPLPGELEGLSWSKVSVSAPKKIKTHLQELAENSFDLGHFSGLHGMGYPEIKINAITKDSIQLTQKMDYHQFGLNFRYKTELEQVGANNVINRVQWEKIEFIVMLCNTPIDNEHIHVRSLVSVKTPKNSLARWAIKQFVLWYVNKELKKDTPIWENKRYYKKPLLCHADGPIYTLRNWITQFY